MNGELMKFLRNFTEKCSVNYHREKEKSTKDVDPRPLKDLQKKAEGVDIKLLDDFANFMETKYIGDSKYIGDFDEKLLKKIDEFKNFLGDLENEVNIKLPSAPDELSKEYEEFIRMLEKQRHSVELMEQIFEILKPSEISEDISKELLDYFKMLERFQEASFKYKQTYRDHLIHSLRVFLLSVSLLHILDHVWICSLRRFLQSCLRGFDIKIDTQLFSYIIHEKELWKLSLHGACVMSFFHDIGMVYSRYDEMIEGLNDRIFKNVSDSGPEKNRAIFDYKMTHRLRDDAEELINNRISTFEQTVKRMHRKNNRLISRLQSTFKDVLKAGISDEEKPRTIREKIKKVVEMLGRVKKVAESSSLSDEEKLHGAFALLNTYTFEPINEILFGTTVEEIKATLEKIDMPRLTRHFRAYQGAAGKKPQNLGTMIDKETIPQILDDEGKKFLKLVKELKLEKVLNILVLCEAFNSIFVHDMDEFPYLSPFSELLIFADTAQEWDRIEYKEGKKESYEKDQIEIWVLPCKRCMETYFLILSFYEKMGFDNSNRLEKAVNSCRNKYNCNMNDGTGAFVVHFHIEASTINSPLQPIFTCPYFAGDINDIKDFRVDALCKNCQLAKG